MTQVVLRTELLREDEYNNIILEQDKIDKIISKKSFGALINAFVAKNKGSFANWASIKRWLEQRGYQRDIDNKLIIRD